MLFLLPDGHVGTWDLGELDGTRETLVTLRVIVLEADLEFDGLEEVALLLFVGVLEELLYVSTHTSDRDLRHDVGLPIDICGMLLVRQKCVSLLEGKGSGESKWR